LYRTWLNVNDDVLIRRRQRRQWLQQRQHRQPVRLLKICLQTKYTATCLLQSTDSINIGYNDRLKQCKLKQTLCRITELELGLIGCEFIISVKTQEVSGKVLQPQGKQIVSCKPAVSVTFFLLRTPTIPCWCWYVYSLPVADAALAVTTTQSHTLNSYSQTQSSHSSSMSEDLLNCSEITTNRC